MKYSVKMGERAYEKFHPRLEYWKGAFIMNNDKIIKAITENIALLDSGCI